MRTQRLGQSSLFTPRLAYGCMRIAGTWEPKEISQTHRDRATFADASPDRRRGANLRVAHLSRVNTKLLI